eukprot:gene6984-54_t
MAQKPRPPAPALEAGNLPPTCLEQGRMTRASPSGTRSATNQYRTGPAFERKLCGVLSAESFKRSTPIWDASVDVQVEDGEVEEVEVDEDAEVLDLRNMMVCCANLKGTINENGMVAFSAQQPGFKVTDKQVAELIEKAHVQGDSRVEMYPWHFTKAAGMSVETYAVEMNRVTSQDAFDAAAVADAAYVSAPALAFCFI